MNKAANKQLVLKRKQEGASLIEYAVIAALVVVVAVGALGALGGQLTTTFENIKTALTGAGAGGGGD